MVRKMENQKNNIPNLDKICAKIGFEVINDGINNEKAKEFEREITKALGILMEDGLFAYAIWLESKKKEDDDVYSKIIEKSKELLKDEKLKLTKTDKDDLIDAILNDISNNLQKTILAKQLLERMLIYARYRAKALQSD